MPSTTIRATVDTFDRLRRFEALSHLSDPQIEQLAALVEPLDLAAGDAVVREGEESSDAYLIESGTVRIQRDTPYGQFTLATLGAGELFGEASFVDRLVRSSDALTAEASVLVRLASANLAPLLAEDQRFALALYWCFWRSLSQKLRRTNQKLGHFFAEADAKTPENEEATRQTGEFRVGLAAKRDLFREAKLSAMEINFLATLSREKRLKPGEVLFREGQEGEAMYVVLDGRVMISKHIAQAGQEALAFCDRGDFFGEMALIDREPRSADATADQNGAVVLAIPRDVVAGILDMHKVSSPRLLELLCNLVAKRLREIDEKLVSWHIFSAGSGTTLT